ncbi:MAG: hypothetical protein EHM71_03520 [Zetaproteobacteria bacterium]|nr:MAG: hypothetical protein EHM71_03520 [Zetaproteobacteria bacterium]
MNLIDPVLSELSHEAATTRRLLERVPSHKLTWSPHQKSMPLGRLATHIAEIPGWVGSIVEQDEFDIGASGYVPPTLGSAEEIVSMFDKHVAMAAETLKRQSNDRLLATWRLKKNGQLVVEMPRLGMIRTFLMNHLIHHRGQLSVYLRLQDVALPSIYGPTADQPM